MNEHASVSYILSDPTLSGNRLNVTIRREGGRDERYRTGVPYQWRFEEETEWKDDVLSAWQEPLETQFWTVAPPRPPAGSSGLLLLRLTAEATRVAFVNLGTRKTLRYRFREEKEGVFLYLQSASGRIDVSGVYLYDADSGLRFPLPWETLDEKGCMCSVAKRCAVMADRPADLKLQITEITG